MSFISERLEGRPEKFWNFGRYLWRSYTEDSCQTTAAALTYQTLFAIVPSLALVYAFLEVLQVSKGLNKRFEEFIFTNIVPENAAVVQEYLVSFSEQARNLGGPSAAVLIVTSFLMLFTIERTFNEIWRVKEPRHGSQRFLMYWAVFTLGGPFVMASLFVTTYIESLPLISDVSAQTRGLHVVPILLSSGILTLVYVVVPNCFVRVKHAAIGALMAGCAAELAKVLFAEIMAMSNFEAIYGTFAAVPLFLLWIYVSWTIVLLGAEMVKSLGIYRFEEDVDVEAPLFQLIVVLELFYRAHQKGDVLTDREIRKYTKRIDLELWSEMKSRLIELNIIKAVDQGGLILSKDLNEISLWDLYVAFPWQLPNVMKGEQGWEKVLSDKFSTLYANGQEVLAVDLETIFKQG